MAFFNKERQEPNQEPNQESAPAVSMKKSARMSDLQRLLETNSYSVNVHLDDEDNVRVELGDTEIYSPAPVPPSSSELEFIDLPDLPEPPVLTPVYTIRQLNFVNISHFIEKMEYLLSQGIEMSQNQTNDFATFLARPENSSHHAKWEYLAFGMSQILANCTNIKGALYPVKEWDAFVHALQQSKATKGFSIKCYLNLHNQTLGQYLLNNEPRFSEINLAFVRYLNNRQTPNASQNRMD